MAYTFTSISSPVGRLYLVGGGEKLQGLFFNPEKMQQHFKGEELTRGNSAVLKKTAQQLKEYFAGKRTRFSIPLSAAGTAFQKKVWQNLSKIPFGETVSYQGLARMAGKVKASRAVGGANGKNPICIVVPCHRVIAADGGIGGFTGGLAKKRKLLAIEQRAGKKRRAA
jgi:methylated-DNA-[protein]-cysteine S-methyltransferase